MTHAEYDAPLSELLQSFLRKEDWDDVEISTDPDDPSVASCAINLLLLNQIFPTWLETDEELQIFQIFVYSPILIPNERFAEAVALVNLINVELRLGRLAVVPDDRRPDFPARLQFRIGIDIEGGALCLKQMDSMLQAATFAFERYRAPLSEILEDGTSARRVWQDFKTAPQHLC